MKTPAGVECRYFYGDYHRGKKWEECRLLNSNNPPLEWQEKLCSGCPVPAILRANTCEYMQLIPKLQRSIPLIGRYHVIVEAYCSKTKGNVKEPHIGCGQCHQLPEVFIEGA